MVDVARNDRPAARNFRTNEVRDDFLREAGPETLPAMLTTENLRQARTLRAGGAQLLDIGAPVVVLANGDILHLGRDDATPGVVHLADVGTRPGPLWSPLQSGEAHFIESAIGRADASKIGTQIGERLAVASFGDPPRAQRRQPLPDVNLRQRIRIRSRTVVNIDRRVLLTPKSCVRVRLGDFAHRYPDVRAATGDVNLARIGQRLDGCLIYVGIGSNEFVVSVHGVSLRRGVAKALLTRGACKGGVVRQDGMRTHHITRCAPLPYDGMTRTGSKGLSQPAEQRRGTPNVPNQVTGKSGH